MAKERSIIIRSEDAGNESARIVADDGKLKLLLPGGVTLEFMEENKDEGLSNTEFLALEVMKMAVIEAFPEETSGIDESQYQVETVENVRNLPKSRELNYELALRWAGANLAANRWSADRVADLILSENRRVQTGYHLGNVTRDGVNKLKARLRNKIAEYYPGTEAGKKRRKPVEDW